MSSTILNGWAAIAAYMGKTVYATIQLYKREGFPVVKTSSGMLTSKAAIEAWIIRNGVKRPKKEKK